jgi:hypothetical protein
MAGLTDIICDMSSRIREPRLWRPLEGCGGNLLHQAIISCIVCDEGLCTNLGPLEGTTNSLAAMTLKFMVNCTAQSCTAIAFHDSPLLDVFRDVFLHLLAHLPNCTKQVKHSNVLESPTYQEYDEGDDQEDHSDMDHKLSIRIIDFV